jgi:hypothetical protein
VVNETTNGVTKYTLHGPMLDQPLKRDGKWFTPNDQGSTTKLLDDYANEVQGYKYRPFGELAGNPAASSPFQLWKRRE